MHIVVTADEVVVTANKAHAYRVVTADKAHM